MSYQSRTFDLDEKLTFRLRIWPLALNALPVAVRTLDASIAVDSFRAKHNIIDTVQLYHDKLHHKYHQYSTIVS